MRRNRSEEGGGFKGEPRKVSMGKVPAGSPGSLGGWGELRSATWDSGNQGDWVFDACFRAERAGTGAGSWRSSLGTGDGRFEKLVRALPDSDP